LPVHSAHVGQELEVYYRWHPYFRRKVRIRQVQERADGRYVRVTGPAGVVVLMAAWMLDPVPCAAMTVGPPRVAWEALIELDQLLIDARLNRAPPKWARVVQEKRDEDFEDSNGIVESPSVESVVRLEATNGIERDGPGQGHGGIGADPDAGRRPHRRGARR
jgi:hypothetical protein